MDTYTAIIIIIGLIFSYYVVYRKNKLLGHITYVCVGGGTIIAGTTDADTMIGTLIMIISIINTAICVLTPPKKKN